MKAKSLFTAPYSSRLNNCEHVWATLKRMWATLISRVTVDYDHKNLERDVSLTAKMVGQRLTPAILKATDGLYQKCLDGELL